MSFCVTSEISSFSTTRESGASFLFGNTVLKLETEAKGSLVDD